MTNRYNPYIIGRSIHEPEKFFGREELFEFIRSNLNNNEKIILLYGQRRIGKSSVLKQVPHQIDLQKFVFVSCDFQEHSISSLGDILYYLAKEIAEELSANLEIILYSQEEFNNNPEIFSDNFLPQIYQQLDNKNLLLLLDEFDVVSRIDQTSDDRNRFFSYLHSLINREEKIFIITVLGRFKDDWQNLVNLFKNAPTKQFNLLNKENTKKLITEPAKEMLDYQDDAIEEIWKLSSGHPCLIQYICFNLFGYVRSKQRSTVTCEDIKVIIEPTLENATLALDGLWDGLCTHEKLVFSGVAEAQKIALKKNKSIPKDPLIQLKICGIIQTEELIQAVEQLTKKDYLYLNNQKEVRVKIEFIRRWLEKYKPLKQQIITSSQVLEEIRKEEIDQILKDAQEPYRQGEIYKEIEYYEKILKLNPNHFTTLPILAEIYLQFKNFEKALELHHRGYQIDCIRNIDCTRNKVGLLLAGEKYGEDLIKQGKLSQAKIKLEAVLEIEPDRKSAKDKLQEIEAIIIEQQKLEMKQEDDKQQLQIHPFIWLLIGIITPIIGGIIAMIIYQSLTSCPQGQQRFNNECITIVQDLPVRADPIQSNISSGDRTLFFTIPNSYRDQGIEAFKQGNYPQAIKLFQQAITANRSDPEVRIYYNNAIAREKGNPFTLAVVVPADNGQARALEILRGVAQSQEQFNANGGRDGRSLEILIANDGDDKKKAQQIAQYLANDKSVLGVIGHGSSTTTKAALNIYEQAGIPVISPTSSANTLEGKNFFRTTPSDAALGEKLAKYAIDSRLNKVVIVYNSDNSYSNSLREEFRTNFKGQIISLIDLNNKTLNIEQELKDSAYQKPQAVILLPNVENTATALDIAKVNVDNKLGLKLLGGDALYNAKTLQNGGNALEGLVLAVPWFREAPQAQEFSQAAKQMWGGEISWRTATSYDAAQAFINSLSAQPSRETILQKLTQINLSAKLTSGNNLKFQKGERQNEAVLVKVESGQFKCLNQCSP